MIVDLANSKDMLAAAHVLEAANLTTTPSRDQAIARRTKVAKAATETRRLETTIDRTDDEIEKKSMVTRTQSIGYLSFAIAAFQKMSGCEKKKDTTTLVCKTHQRRQKMRSLTPLSPRPLVRFCFKG